MASGFSPMLFAVRSGHTAIVRALLKAGADINETAQPARNAAKYLRKGASALTTAIENGHFELAALLVDLGADPGDLRSGYSPLHILCWIRKPDRGEDEGDPVPEGSGSLTSEQLIRKLVAKGADVNARLTGGPSGGGRIARKGCTPFMMAADTADTAYLRLLKELGADPNVTNVDGCTPLMAAAGLGTRSAEEEAGTDEEAVEAVGYLLSLGADINAVSNLGDTAMHGAAFANFPKVVKFLDCERGEDRGVEPEEQTRLDAVAHLRGTPVREFQTVVRDDRCDQGSHDRAWRHAAAAHAAGGRQGVRAALGARVSVPRCRPFRCERRYAYRARSPRKVASSRTAGAVGLRPSTRRETTIKRRSVRSALVSTWPSNRSPCMTGNA